MFSAVQGQLYLCNTALTLFSTYQRLERTISARKNNPNFGSSKAIPLEVLNLLYPNDLNKGYKSYCCINNVAPPPKKVSYHALN